jgi:hypothetical protein
MIGEVYEYFQGPRSIPLIVSLLINNELYHTDRKFMIGDKVIEIGRWWTSRTPINYHLINVFGAQYAIPSDQFLAHFRRARS